MIVDLISLAISAGISIWLGLKILKLVTPMIKAITERNKAITRACATYADMWGEEI